MPRGRDLDETATQSIVNSAVQAVKLPTSPATGISVARTIGTTTLSAAQLQQLAAARGQVFVSGLGTQVRPGQAQDPGHT